jgi:hypothetical protein
MILIWPSPACMGERRALCAHRMSINTGAFSRKHQDREELQKLVGEFIANGGSVMPGASGFECPAGAARCPGSLMRRWQSATSSAA